MIPYAPPFPTPHTERGQFFPLKRDYRPEEDKSLSRLNPEIQHTKDLIVLELKGPIKSGWHITFFDGSIFSSQTKQAYKKLNYVVEIMGTTDSLGQHKLEIELSAAFKKVKSMKDEALMKLLLIIYSSAKAVHKSNIQAIETYKKENSITEDFSMLAYFRTSVKETLKKFLPEVLTEISVSYLV